jgi:hypothetical protein
MKEVCARCLSVIGGGDTMIIEGSKVFCSDRCARLMNIGNLTHHVEIEEATRNPVSYRFDLIPSKPLKLIAEGFAYGAEKYGDKNYLKSRLTGNKGPINHALNHINDYRQNGEMEELVHAAMNILMEMEYKERFDNVNP